MKTIPKIVAGASLCLAATSISIAQISGNTTPSQEGSTANALQEKWFAFDEGEAKYRFTTELDKGEYLLIRFKKLSDWGTQDDFNNALSAADKVMGLYRDSLLQAQYTRTIDISVPANRKNLITRFGQVNESGNLMTISSEGASALKVGMDTLRILQTVRSGAQIQYTFLLKDLGNYYTYAQDAAWKEKTAGKIDSIVVASRASWKRPDAASHRMKVIYNPATGLTSYDRSRTIGGGILVVEGGMGVSLVRNMLCPNVEYGIGVYLRRTQRESTFVRFTGRSIYRYAETAPNRFKGYTTTFINLEIGGESNHKDKSALFYKTSLGFGYKLLNKQGDERDPTMSKQMYRLFFSYHVNKFLAVVPEFVSNFRRDDDRNRWIGVSVNLNLF